MTLALALVAIFAAMAVLMYLNRLPAIVALPIMAVAIVLVALVPWAEMAGVLVREGLTLHALRAALVLLVRAPWRDVANIISDGAFLLHRAYATAILGAILAEVVSKTGVAETIVKKAAELGGDRPLLLALLLTAVVAVLFTTLGGLGAVIMVATIVFPVLLALGVPRLAVGCLFLLGMSLGGIFNLTNWQLYTDVLRLQTATILSFALPLAAIMAAATVVFAVVWLRPARLSRYWQDPDPSQPPAFAPWYALLTPIVPLLPVLGFSVYNIVTHLERAGAVAIDLPLLRPFHFALWKLVLPEVPPFQFPIITAMTIGVAYGLLTARRPAQGRIQLLTRSTVDGIGAVAPAVALMLGIGMLVQAVRHELVLDRIQPLLAQVLPDSPLGYVVFFTVAAPLALYRGPLNIYGMGLGLAALIAAAPGLGPAAVMAALLSVGQIQGVCDPTNTHNVWIANYVGVDVQRILRTTLPYVWATAAAGLIVGALLFLAR